MKWHARRDIIDVEGLKGGFITFAQANNHSLLSLEVLVGFPFALNVIVNFVTVSVVVTPSVFQQRLSCFVPSTHTYSRKYSKRRFKCLSTMDDSELINYLVLTLAYNNLS